MHFGFMVVCAYRASMPKKPSAPARPAPTTAVGYEAPPVETAEPEGDPDPVPVGERVGETTVEMTVLLTPLGPALMVPALAAGVVENGVGVEVATGVVYTGVLAG
jgi:hypothetical protein